VETAAAEPVIQTIVETVADAPDAPVDSMPDAPEDSMPDAPVETVAENAEATAEAKSEVV
jgi:hypothetical protein